MADGQPDAQNEAVLVDVYRHIARHLAAADMADREALLRVPLWDGSGWTRKRPIYAVDDPSLTTALESQLPTWHAPASLASLGALPYAVGVQPLKRAAFVPCGIGPRSAQDGKELQPIFASAVRHLKARLQRNDPGLYRANSVGWDALERARVVVTPRLALEVQVSDQSFMVPARAHVRPEPLPVMLCLAAPDEAGSDETTGRAISAIFDATDSDGRALDREKVALAWGAAWRLAVRGDAAQTLDLPSEDTRDDIVLSGFAADLAHGKRRGRVFESLTKLPATSVRGHPLAAQTDGADDQLVQVRELKSAGELDVVRWEIVPPRAPNGQRLSASNALVLRGVPAKTSTTSTSEPISRAAPRGYTDQELETVATDVLRRVLLTAGRTASDFRAIRRLGADVVDDIGQFFEIKASYGNGGDSVSLTAHEAKRAQVAKPGECFLAIVTGLEKGYQTQVRIIADPLENLDWGEDGSLTVTGIRRAGIVVDVDLQ